jgi:hypothetical protein
LVLLQDQQALHPLQCQSLQFPIRQGVAFFNSKQDCEEHKSYRYPKHRIMRLFCKKGFIIEITASYQETLVGVILITECKT